MLHRPVHGCLCVCVFVHVCVWKLVSMIMKNDNIIVCSLYYNILTFLGKIYSMGVVFANQHQLVHQYYYDVLHEILCTNHQTY